MFHADHQVGPHNAFVAGPVFDIGGCGQLATGFDALHQNGREHRAAGVDAGGVTCWAGADDQDAGVASVGHGSLLRMENFA